MLPSNLSQEFLWELAYDIFIVWFVFELIFFGVISYVVHSSLQKLKRPPAYDTTPSQLAKKMFDDVDMLKTYDFKSFMEGWFCGAKIEDIRYGNLKSFFAWALFANFEHNLDSAQSNELDSVVQEVCRRYSFKPQEGHNYDVKHVKMTIEPILFVHRPLTIYLISGVSAIISDITMSFAGFQRCENNKLKYWHRPSQANAGGLPMGFFHGITTGWSGALTMINMLATDREIFLFDLDCIKINSLNFNMPSCEWYSNAVKNVLDKHGVQKISIVGHSFGSITSGWFAKAHPQYVAHITLIDPVSLMLHLPDVAYNFLYRQPRTLVEWGIFLLASREITISNTLRRNFWWYKNQLWLEDLPDHVGVLVSLAGGDEVTHSPSVEQYVDHCYHLRKSKNPLYHSPISSINHTGQSHAEILFRSNSLRQLADRLHLQEKAIMFQ